MYHVVIFHARLTHPIVLRYKTRAKAEQYQNQIEDTKSGSLILFDGYDQRIVMSAADVAATLLVDHARTMEANGEEAAIQHRAQQAAAQKAQASGPRLMTAMGPLQS